MSKLGGQRGGARPRVSSVSVSSPSVASLVRDCVDTPAAHADATSAVAEGIIAERRRLARELHDGPVQSLWFLGAEIRRLRMLAAGAPGELSAGLQALQATWAQVYDELRQVMGDLHQPLHADNALIRALERSLASLERRTSVVTELYTELDGDALLLDRASQAQLVRICQAALANVQRHSQARRVRVDLHPSAGGALLSIEDDGVGFDPAQVRQRPTEHFGLSMIRERAELLGGRVEVTSTPGQGTCLRVWVPARSA
jgi:two-component system, NarL family, nitrate/nitrite sensor histidine kinase NarX